MRVPYITITLAAVAVALAAGCSRSVACRDLDGSHAEQDGLQTSVTCCRRDDQGIHMRLAIRNTSDRDVFLGRNAAGEAPVVIQAGERRIPGQVQVERADYSAEGMPDTQLIRIPGILRINCHSSETVRVDIPAQDLDALVPWNIHVQGAWSAGTPVSIDVPVQTPQISAQGGRPNGGS